MGEIKGKEREVFIAQGKNISTSFF